MDMKHSARLTTALNRDGVQHHVEQLLPQLDWRRGASELSNELMLTGSDGQGFQIHFSMHEYEAGGTVRVSVREGHATGDDLMRQFLDDVLPQLERTEPGPGHSGPSVGAPPESESYAVLLAKQRAATRGSAPSPAEWPPPDLLDPVRGIDRPSSARPADQRSRVGQQSAGAELLIDLQDWLPGWGEHAVTVRTTSPHLVLDIEYDLSRQPEDGLAVISVVFEWSRYYCWYWAPSMLGICSPGGARESEAVWNIGRTELVERIANNPLDQTINRKRNFQEYSVWFQDSGVGYNIVADGVRVE